MKRLTILFICLVLLGCAKKEEVCIDKIFVYCTTTQRHGALFHTSETMVDQWVEACVLEEKDGLLKVKYYNNDQVKWINVDRAIKGWEGKKEKEIK